MASARSTLVFLLAFACALVGCASAPPGTPGLPAVNLSRVMGTWYVIAHVPYFTERGHVGGRDEYALQEDGRIGVRYLYRTGFHQPWKVLEAMATVEPDTGNREWRLKFYRVVSVRQRVLEVAPDGSWMLVDAPGRELAWIFARTPVIDEELYRDLIKRLDTYGVNTDKVWRMPQVPEQVGRPGFERPNDP